MKLIYPLNIKNEFVFNSSARDFTVEEIPLYAFTGEGEHLVLHVRKKDMTSWEMLEAISYHVGVQGLKRQACDDYAVCEHHGNTRREAQDFYP
jgi:tRNA(Glu) U13 pseudouridine synthase TruD